eukprot:scaffold309223_cov43-Attheya_sp.AAC.1
MGASISGLSTEDASITGISPAQDDDDDDEDDELTMEQRVASAVLASEFAALLVEELVDDGTPLSEETKSLLLGETEEGPVSMSPHRLCRYTDNLKSAKNDKGKENNKAPSSVSEKAREVFGSHTDTSFVTLVPVAEVSGLEVFDEVAEQWYRPELAARRHWEEERTSRNLDPTALFETVTVPKNEEEEETVELPWYARYVVILPGELMQLVTRDEVPAAVHRVVAVKDKDQVRLSAPVLLRARSGMTLDATRYFGEN